MEIRLNTDKSSSLARSQAIMGRTEWFILAYWVIAAVVGMWFLRDWIVSWNVPATLAKPWLVALLVATWILSQGLYVLVAHHDGRPIRWGPALLFAFGNGIFETFAFALVYRSGETFGTYLVGMFAPSFSNIAGFVLGVLLFVTYGGLIHGLFWFKVLPPHLKDSPRMRAIRKRRPLAELVLVIAWSMCFWLTRDIWTVVFFHILIDFGLMLRVRPELFMRKSAAPQIG